MWSYLSLMGVNEKSGHAQRKRKTKNKNTKVFLCSSRCRHVRSPSHAPVLPGRPENIVGMEEGEKTVPWQMQNEKERFRKTCGTNSLN